MKILILTLLFGIAASSSWGANAEQAPSTHEQKLQAVANLLTRSTISKQVLHSNNQAAIQHYQFSKTLYEDAVEAFKAGELDKSNKLINKSRQALFDSIEFANLRGSQNQRSKNHYESLRKSANALITALQRISDEKGRQDQHQKIYNDIRNQLAQSDNLYFQEEYTGATSKLEKVLKTIKSEISQMRSGETLTRSLSFTSAKEEYEYELDRNDTFFMLIDMFLSDKESSPQAIEQINGTIRQAKDYRKQAETLAADNKHSLAIEKLEQSTVKIIAQIRQRGISIPP
ncbi:MAG: hypothetical protein QNJ78_06125 [Gammaproteobacteria bacterium]|nr:hypothetical protein [Gammaproteobacteria bacterium]